MWMHKIFHSVLLRTPQQNFHSTLRRTHTQFQKNIFCILIDRIIPILNVAKPDIKNLYQYSTHFSMIFFVFMSVFNGVHEYNFNVGTGCETLNANSIGHLCSVQFAFKVLLAPCIQHTALHRTSTPACHGLCLAHLRITALQQWFSNFQVILPILDISKLPIPYFIDCFCRASVMK